MIVTCRLVHAGVTGRAWRGGAGPCVLSWEYQLLDGTRSFPASRTKGERGTPTLATTCENRTLRKIPFRIQPVD